MEYSNLHEDACIIHNLSLYALDKDVEKPKKCEMGSAVLDNKGMHIFVYVHLC